MPHCFVILSGRSLFAAGVASRLQQYLPEVDLKIIDLRETDAARHLASVQPAAVILDVTDPEVYQRLPLAWLLRLHPDLKVIHLDPHQAEIQVITSEQVQATEVRDLIQMIQGTVIF